jgi:uncharacterized tellurite resistance protein B-like protein
MFLYFLARNSKHERERRVAMSFITLSKDLLRSIVHLLRHTCTCVWRKISGKPPASLPSGGTTRHARRLLFHAHQGDKETTGVVKAEQLRTLEVMPTEVKILYTQMLATQALADHQLDQQEFSDLYVFMTQIGLDAPARNQVRKFLVTPPEDLVPLADQVLAHVKPEEQQLLKFSMIKDLIRVSRMDGTVSPEEQQHIQRLATHLYATPGQAAQIIAFAEKAIAYDEKLLMGKLTAEEFTRGAKNLAATAASIGVPVTAVYFSGSVIGLSAAGIISGLTELGLGGILGLSSLVTGIGMVVVLGIVTFKLVRWAVTGKERRLEKMREHLIQEVIRLNQQAMCALAEDLNHLASQMEHLASASEQNRAMLRQLHTVYQQALHTLEHRKERYAES